MLQTMKTKKGDSNSQQNFHTDHKHTNRNLPCFSDIQGP